MMYVLRLRQWSARRYSRAVCNLSAAGSWPAPEHDARGNMKVGPKGDDPTVKFHFKYDAWNRQVEVRATNGGNPGDLIATYRGRKR